ncbi:Piwi domain-containing protein [Crepidotus variabilis]|uniref:Piwi domain-containing protein n=1 Tax=Crepidotus variabilis TaxID=179855 RepID=A0A9P6EPK4_9AGAR|nr:Piwi domain-containing protein [Crepidotus variabilis]
MSNTVQIDTNSVQLQVGPFAYYQYDVLIKSTRPGAKDPSPKVKDLLLDHLQNEVAPHLFNPRLIYDRQKIAYCRKLLQFQTGQNATLYVSFNEKQLLQPPGGRGAYEITLSTTGSRVTKADIDNWVSRGPSTEDSEIRARGEAARNLLQLIMRQGPNKRHSVKNGRAYFSNGAGDFKDLHRGIEFWRGIFLSVRTTPGPLILQIDTTSTAVYKGGELISQCLDYLNPRQKNPHMLKFPPNHPTLKQLEKWLSGVRITIKVGQNQKDKSRSKVIRFLEPKGANFLFEKDGREMTVAQYYLENYNIRIRHPDIFAVSLEKKNSLKATIVPAELCEIVPGQICNRLPDEFRPDMVKFSVLNPGLRKSRIQRELSENYLKSEYLAEAGMTLANSLLPVMAKQLTIPRVMYGGEKAARVNPNGSWNVMQSQFFRPTQMKAWAVLNTIPNIIEGTKVQSYMHELLDCCRKLGMRVVDSPFDYQTISGWSQEAIEKALDAMGRTAGQKNLKPTDVVIIVLLAENAALPRSIVKHWGDVTRGVITQCLRQGKFNRDRNNQYWNNVAIKLNARLGGINSHPTSMFWTNVVEKRIGSFMVMGADVSHPSPGQQKPSIAGFVHSWDNRAAKYAALTELQQPRQETIQDIRKFTYTALYNFGMANSKNLPQNIFFFRDGLSEGEYLGVARLELAEIRRGIDAFWEEKGVPPVVKKPKITFVIVTKRHHAVFFPTGTNDPKANCAPGLVVESDVITHILPNFYLQSHSAIIGTSRSSHYLVIQDEIFENNMENLQQFAHHLCYNYAKATRSVSIPSPVYYADLVCSRMMFHLNLASMPDEDASTTSSGNTPFNLDAWKSSFLKLHSGMESRMYFL